MKDKLITAGQYTDHTHTGGLVITETDSLAEVEMIAKNDPAVLDKKLTYQVHPWEPLLGMFSNKN